MFNRLKTGLATLALLVTLPAMAQGTVDCGKPDCTQFNADRAAILAMAGSLAGKKYVPPSLGTLPTDKTPFALWLTLVILIVGALTFFPALALGPIVEHLTMLGGN